MTYPPAPRLDLVEPIHGHPVADPYRWLEDPGSPATEAWSAAQDVLVRARLDAIPGRRSLAARLTELLSAGMVTAPVHRGDRRFFRRQGPDQEHPVVIVRDAGGSERVLLDPSTLSDDDSVTLDGMSPSPDGSRLAYLVSESGDEEASLWVLDVATGDVVDGPIDRTRYSSLAWAGDDLFYVRRLPPRAVPAGEEQFHRRVYRHRIGTDPETDWLVFGEGRDKTEYHSLATSPDGRWLVVAAAKGTAPRNDVYLADLADLADPAGRADPRWRVVQEGRDARTWARVHHDGRLYLLTDAGAPRRRLAVADPADPATWHDLVPETDAVLEAYAVTEDAVVVSATHHAVARVAVHDRVTGERRFDVALPGLGSVNGVSARPDGGHHVWVGYADFLQPPSVSCLDTRTGTLTPDMPAPGRVDVDGVTAEQVTYTSDDGTDVRLFVLRPAAGGEATGPRPTVLSGYGGFGLALTPQYSANALAWVERGGVYAVANLRGGSEEGEAWHRAGMREHKQNVFDDFAAAARWLVGNGVTTPAQLAISGGSNGGLLVGAAMVRNPELYAAAVCSAPLLDMVRYERFGLGLTWNDEYGTVGDPEEAGWLLSYSPYHHVVEGVRYPSVLFTVFDADTRVDPCHARKMCAALQHATAATADEAPVLLRREQKVGHAARSRSRSVSLAVDTTAFLAWRLGLAPPGGTPS